MLTMKCMECGQEVEVKAIEDTRKYYIFEYSCAKCGMTFLEEIPKRSY